MNRKIFRTICLVSLSLVSHPSLATSAYPAEPIKLIVPYVAGASTDTLGRLVGQSISEKIKQTVIVENKAGAGGTIAADFVKRQKPDGYTIMLSTDGILSVNPVLYKKLGYDSIKDFTPLSISVTAPLVLAVRGDSQFKSLKDVIDKAKANPGKLTFGSAGVGTSQHMAGALFADMADVKINHVPYKGGAPAMNDLLGGHIDMMFVQTASAEEYAKAGKVRILGIGSPKRSVSLPDVPTFEELGLTGYDADTWYGFNMPAGADAKVASVLHDAIVEAVKANQPKLESLGYVIVNSSGAEMTQSVASNTKKWGELAKKAGVYQKQ
ncbi:MAG: Bug family tripartite tricarboxylate transporter substrate binding protein [Advenella sp.]